MPDPFLIIAILFLVLGLLVLLRQSGLYQLQKSRFSDPNDSGALGLLFAVLGTVGILLEFSMIPARFAYVAIYSPGVA